MRLEDLRFLTGRGRYLADLTVPGMLEMAVLRSPHAHARIRDVAGPPGLLTVRDLGPADRPIPTMLGPRGAPRPLAAEVVRHVGEPVGVITAENRYAAEDLLDAVRVEYEPLAAVTSIEQARAPGAPPVHAEIPGNIVGQGRIQRGDLGQAFADAPVRVSAHFAIARGHGSPMETRGCLAHWEDDRLTLWVSGQSAFNTRESLCHLLALPPERVRVIVPDVGGAFGLKGHIYQEEICAALLSMRTGRPVRWVEDRREHFQATHHDRDFHFQIEVAAGADGRLQGLRARIEVDLGAYSWYGMLLPINAAAHLLGPYDWPALEISWQAFYTHLTPCGAYRGAGRPSGAFAIERALDRVAEALGMDPVVLRRRNLIPATQMPYDTGVDPYGRGNLVYDSGNYPALLDRALERFGYEEMRREQARGRAEGRQVGIGIGLAIETTAGHAFEGCRLSVGDGGTITLATGAVPQGQGQATILARLAATELGLRPEEIRVVTGDTAAIARGVGTFGSRTAVLAGNATAQAARDLSHQLRQLAAQQLEAAPEDLELAGGQARVRGVPARSVSLAELAARSLQPLVAEAFFTAVGPTISSSCQVCAVEVEAGTSRVKILRHVAVDDCGRVLDEEVVRGQVMGAIAQGVGSSLYEELTYSPEGDLLTSSFMDYLLPTATDVPETILDHIEVPSPGNPLGLKGAGEGGSMTVAPALAGALEDALRPQGVRVDRLPVSPSRLWAASGQKRG